MPRLVSGLEAKVGKRHVERAVPHDEPLVLRLGQNDETATLRPLVAVGLTDVNRQRCDAWSGPGKARIIEGGLKRPGRASRSAPLLKSPVSTTAPSLRQQVADQEEQGNTDGSPLDALVVDVDVGHREAGARRVRVPAELAGNNHAVDGPREIPEREGDLDLRARGLALKGVLVEAYSAPVAE